MEKCPRFEICDAPLCPLDPDILRKQRSIQRRQTKTWFNRPVTHQQLYDASRPRQMTDEQKAEITKRLSDYRKKAA